MGGGVIDGEAAGDVGPGSGIDAEELDGGGGIFERLIIIRVTNAVGARNWLWNDLGFDRFALGGGGYVLGSGLVEV